MTDEGTDLGIPGIGPAERVGQGGFGAVYRAVQRSSGGVVAVKVLAGHLDDTGRARFQRETAALGALRGHPNICTVFDAGTTADGRPYLVMEYAPSTLAQRVAELGARPWQEVADLGVKLAGALQTAHDAQLLHRDVKPENVLLTRFGEARLADFGLARFSDDTLSRGVTATVAHAAPELLWDGAASVASDVYALGSTLFVALSGRAAFALSEGAHQSSVLRKIAEDPVPELPGVPEEMSEVVRRAMAKAPADRHASARAMGEALQGVQRANGEAVTPLPLEEEAALAARAAAGERPDDTADDRTTDVPHDATVAVDRANRTRPDPVGALVDDASERPEPGRRPNPRLVMAIGALAAVVVLGIGLALAQGGGDPPRTEATPTTTATAAAQQPTVDEIRSAIPARDWEMVSVDVVECSVPESFSCTTDGLEVDFTIDCPGTAGASGQSDPDAPCDIQLLSEAPAPLRIHHGPPRGYEVAFAGEVPDAVREDNGCEPSLRYRAILIPTSAELREGTWTATSLSMQLSVSSGPEVDDPACSTSITYDVAMRTTS